MQAPWCSVHLNLFNCDHQINNRASAKYLLGEMWKILSCDELLDLKLINAEECFPISKSVIWVSNLAHRPLSLLWDNTSELHTDTSTVKLVNLEHQSVHNDVLWTKFMHNYTLFFNWTNFKFLRIQLVWNTCVQLYLISYQLMRLFQTATCGNQMSMPYVPHGTERELRLRFLWIYFYHLKFTHVFPWGNWTSPHILLEQNQHRIMPTF